MVYPSYLLIISTPSWSWFNAAYYLTVPILSNSLLLNYYLNPFFGVDSHYAQYAAAKLYKTLNGVEYMRKI